MTMSTSNITEPTRFETLMAEFLGGKDIMDVDFDQFNDSMTISDFDFSKVRGSIRLSQGMFLSPKEEKEIRDNFFKLQFPK